MADISTDRLEPTAPAIAPAEREERNHTDSRPPRRPASRPKPSNADKAEPDGPPHQVDQMA